MISARCEGFELKRIDFIDEFFVMVVSILCLYGLNRKKKNE